MKIGIIFAMEIERDAYLALAKNDIDVTTYVCGIGKVNAATTTTKAIIEDKLDLVINCGIAGGINTSKQFEVYYATELNYSDVDVTMFDYKIGQVPSMPATYHTFDLNITNHEIKLGKIVSQDTFATDSQKQFLADYYSDYVAVDMESCAIAQACYKLNTDVMVIRSISDLVFEPNNHIDYSKASEIACEKAAKALITIIEQVKKQ